MKAKNPTGLYRFRNFSIIRNILTVAFLNCLSMVSFLPFAAAVGRTVCLTKPTAQNWKLPKTYTDKPTLLTSAT